MGDYHVNRLGVYAWQHVELTSTNVRDLKFTSTLIEVWSAKRVEED